MAIERWTDERLDQLATDVDGLRASTTELRVTAESLLQTVVLQQQSIEASQRNFEVIASQIRGLQLENRRMLQEMRGLPPDDPGELAQ